MNELCRSRARLIAIALTLLLSSFEVTAQNQQAQTLYNRALAATCANCHGTEAKGIENAGMPLINQLTEKNMLTQLMAFKTGARAGTIMPQLMKGYTDEQLQTIASVLGQK